MRLNFMYRWFDSRLAKGRPTTRGSRRKPARLGVEQLEDRTLPSAVNWINTGSGNWDDASNWIDTSTNQNRVPTSSDDVSISTTAAATITIQSGDAIPVRSVTTGSNDTLSITGGSLTVTAGSSTLSGPLSMTGGALTASGFGVSFTANGSTTVAQANLFSFGGATLALARLSSYVSNGNSFEASGTGSVLDVSALTSVTQQADWNVITLSGGEIKLSGLTSLTSTNGINISENGGPILLDNLATLDHVSFTDTGVSSSFAKLANADGSSLDVEGGGHLALSGLTSYFSNFSSFTAGGSGSVLDVSALTTLTQQGPWSISVSGGAQINLGGLTSLSGTNRITIRDTGHSTLLDGKLATLSGVNVSLDGTDTQIANSWTSFTGSGGVGTLTITGASYTLPGLKDVDGAVLFANGGSLALPGLSSYTSNGSDFEASGTGSVLDVSALRTVTQQGNWVINTFFGGEIKLSGLTALNSTQGISISSSGTGSTIDLSALTSMTGGISITVGDGGELNVSMLASGTITLSNGGRIDNQATVVSMAAAGTSGATINVPSSKGLILILQNGGTLKDLTLSVGQGTTVALAGGRYTGSTTLNVSQGANIDITDGGSISYSGTLRGSGGGTAEFRAGGLNIGLGGLTLNFPGNMFQWTGGSISSGLGDLTNLGVINLGGSSDKTFSNDGTLDNFGNILQTGSGNLNLHSDNVTATTLKIEPAASYLIGSDSGIELSSVATAVINAGTLAKTAGTGKSVLFVDGPLTNTGAIEADSGTLFLDANSTSEVSGSMLTGGTWNALNGATLQFQTGTAITANSGNIGLGGAGAMITGIAGLASNSGSFRLTSGANFTTASDFTNSGSVTVGAGSTVTVAGSYTHTSSGALNVQIGGMPASGLFGQLKASGAASLAGSFNLALVDGFAASSGQSYNVMSFASGSGSFANFTGLAPTFTESLNPTDLMLNEKQNSIDLAPASVNTSTAAATDGQDVTVSWQVHNLINQAATGAWQDSVYLSATASITSNSILLGNKTHTGGIAADGSYSSSLTAALPALAPGYYYVLVEVDSLYQAPDLNRANNTLAAPALLQVSVPALTLDTTVSDSFSTADQDRYYQVTVPAGGSLAVLLASAAATGATALYVSEGSLPTPYNYQEAAVIVNQPNQNVVVPQVLTAGTYYILAHSVSGSAGTAGFSLTATQGSATTVTAIGPASAGNAGNATVEIDGTNFTAQTGASLTMGATTINASAIDFISASQIFATFNLSGAVVGNYTLAVQQGAQSATAPTMFQVVVGNGAPLEVNLSTPQFLRSGRTETIVITYANVSNNDMIAPLLAISSTNANNVLFSTPDDPNNFVRAAQVLAVSPSGPTGILRPGQSGQLIVTILSDDTISGDQIPIMVDQIEAGQNIDWSGLESAEQPGNVPTAAWNVIWNNLVAMVGSTTDTYNAALAQAATYLGGLGETTTQLSDIATLWTFLISQASADFPTPSLTSIVDAALPTPGSLSLAIDRTFLSSLDGRYVQGIFGLGWATSWQTSLSVDNSGNVTINSGNTLSFFVRQANGGYLDTAGEYGALTQSGGIYTYTDIAGTQYVFLASGSLNYEQDTNGNRITLGYNAQNQLATLTYSNPSDPPEPSEQLTLSYNGQGLVSQVADGTGNSWAYQYDTARHLLFVTGPGNLTNSYSYDTGNNPETANALLSITKPDGSQANFAYDPTTGRLTGTSQNAGANAAKYTYPGEAEVAATDTAGNSFTVWYNELGVPARTQDARGAISIYGYDASGNLVGYTDAAGNSYQYSYDRNGNLTQSVNPLGQTVQMTYGMFSNLTSITDAAGNTTSYAYSAAGNLLSMTYPDGTAQSFAYDPPGNLNETVLQNGDPVSYQNNPEGLLTRQTFADGSSQGFTYDSHGNLLTASSDNPSGKLTGTTTLTYNATNELLSISYPNDQFLNFTYNAAGQRTESVDQSGFTINYAYDSLGRLSELTDGSGNLIVQYTYNNLGQLVQKQNGNGTSTTYGYDPTGDLMNIVNYAPDGKTVNSSFTYTYNNLDEVTFVTDNAGKVTTYGYDLTGQLTQVNLPGGQSITYVYNAAGDRTEVIKNGTPTLYASNADNEITQVGSAVYTYDANGNLHTVIDSTGTTTYNFNDLNQLVSIVAPDGTTTAFQYSPLGFLVGQNVGGAQTSYLVDPTCLGNVVASYNGSGSLIAHYNFALGLVSQTGPNGTGYYDFDMTGNVVGITAASGLYVNDYTYLPFGESKALSATLPTGFLFGGQAGVLTLPNDIYYMRAREYTPGIAQFLTNDPIGVTAGDTNLRRYVGNSPLAYLDPSGLKDVQADAATQQPQSASPQQDFGILGDLYNSVYQAIGNAVKPPGPLPGLVQKPVTSGLEKLGQQLGVKLPSGPAPLSLINGINNSPALIPAATLTNKTNALSANNKSNKESEKQQPASSLAFHDVVLPANDGKLHEYHVPVPANPVGPDTNAELRGNYLFTLNDREFSAAGPIIPPHKPPASNIANGNTLGLDPLDPNALLGPAGYGTQNFMQPTGTWPYTIDFENDGSAAAQTVTVTEQLDPSLDWSTFQLGSFGFGPVNVTVPAGLTQYQTTVSYQNSDGTPLSVLVMLDFNVQTGLLTITFTSLDPQTGQAPTGVFDGFLYPENGTGVGDGDVQYSVEPNHSLTTGTTITQQASVVFDTNAPLATDPAVNTIDAGPPTSSVNPLPATEPPTGFGLTWSGQDDAGGSGIARFDIYVSDNGGPFTLWQSFPVTQTSATFTATLGHTYGFYSVATDNVGNVQSVPAGAEASTRVAITPTVTASDPGGVYSGLPDPASATVTDGNSNDVSGQGSVSFTYYQGSSASGASSPTAPSAAGFWTVVAHFHSTSASYADANSPPLTFQITPAPLAITANDQTMPVGGPLLALTVGYSGFVHGETSASLTTPPAVNTTATTTSPAGDYPITVSGASDPNYAISYKNGTLHIVGQTAGVRLSATPSPSVYAQPVTLTATVTPPGGGMPLGTVTFLDSSTVIAASVPLVNGQAMYTTTTLARGPHMLTARFTAAGGGPPVTSPPWTQTVQTTALEPDPLTPGTTDLAVGGSAGNDVILVTAGARPGQVQVLTAATSVPRFLYSGTFNTTAFGRLLVYGGPGNDFILVDRRLTMPALIDGGPGNDVLIAGGGPTILLGGGGSDLLLGGPGPSLLISGGGRSFLSGIGPAILIGGRTDYDANSAALFALLAEWSRPDLGYGGRVADLLHGGGINGSTVLNATTVHPDTGHAILADGAGLDLYFASADDWVVGAREGQMIVRL
jgi:RHS repeat-associated protein